MYWVTDPAQDELVFEESDETFSAFVAKSKSKRFLMIGLHQTVSSEYWYLNADTPGGTFRKFSTRESGGMNMMSIILESISLSARMIRPKIFDLMKAAVNAIEKKQWQEVIPHRNEVFFEGFELFREYLVVGRTQTRTHSFANPS